MSVTYIHVHTNIGYSNIENSLQALDSTMCEETVFWDLNYSLEYQDMGTDQIKYKVSQVIPHSAKYSTL